MADSSVYVILSKTAINGINVVKLKSKKTGILAYIAECSGPLVDGFVCLATEAHDHDGLPHTLEHLVFMGSELYPYKGVLDLLANRCLAQGTNAWTDVDHTCYTVATAGRQGFLNLLPIYLDHILYPTLTDSAYHTEVHHVNGEGEDAGVVYCEMQARENTPEDMTHFALLQHMYPGHCGYKSETGGRLENLRISTSNDKVRSYHAQYYRPDNLAIVIVGQVSPEELFKSIAEFEDKITGKGPLPSMERPWQSPVPPLKETVVEELRFPTEDESVGMVRIGWRGPKAQNRYMFSAVESVIQYLRETSVSPLQRELVEIADPFCSKVKPMILENTESCVGFTFNGVPAAKLDELEKKVLSVLEGIGTRKEEMDMSRMRTILRRSVLKVLESLENSPEYHFAFNIIGDFLFADNPEQFPAYLDSIPRLQKLLEEPESFWIDLINSVFIKSPHVCIVGRPSLDLSKKMNEEEKQRTAEQSKSLGEEGLKEKEKALKEAVEANETEPPENLLSNVPIPDSSSISHHQVKVYSKETLNQESRSCPEHSVLPVDKFPFSLQLNQIQSSFVELIVILDTSVVPKDLCQFIPLLTKLMFESPIIRDGVVIPYENVVQELAEDTVSTNAGLGLDGFGHSCGRFPQALFISVKVESSKYSKGVQWLREILHHLVFQKDRIVVTANKMLNSASEARRKGREIVKAMSHSMNLTSGSSHNVASMYSQSTFLKDILLRMEKEDNNGEVVQSLAKVRDLLVSPANLRVHVNTDVMKVAKKGDVMLPWQPLIKQAET
jgi:Zn-dependent M16 (insulinase) family peptidase